MIFRLASDDAKDSLQNLKKSAEKTDRSKKNRMKRTPMTLGSLLLREPVFNSRVKICYGFNKRLITHARDRKSRIEKFDVYIMAPIATLLVRRHMFVI